MRSPFTGFRIFCLLQPQGGGRLFCLTALADSDLSGWDFTADGNLYDRDLSVDGDPHGIERCQVL